jgi:GrpB-like predicted nucleotidyltransferase (UPF0157 family)
MSRPEVIPYSARWPAEFRHVAVDVREALRDVALRIDHVGSTSVPGLAAKDVIDVQVTVASLDLDALSGALGGLGFERVVRIDRDHLPPGVTTGDGWRKAFFRSTPPTRRVHVHVRHAGAPNERYALLFRDYLRSHARAAAAYAELKRRLAALEPPLDTGGYADLKDPACDIVIAAAEDWAEESGWRPGPSDG